MAAVNSPKLCVVSGLSEKIVEFQDKLNTEGVKSKLLFTSHAFHSEMMTPIVEPFAKLVENMSAFGTQNPIYVNSHREMGHQGRNNRSFILGSATAFTSQVR